MMGWVRGATLADDCVSGAERSIRAENGNWWNGPRLRRRSSVLDRDDNMLAHSVHPSRANGRRRPVSARSTLFYFFPVDRRYFFRKNYSSCQTQPSISRRQCLPRYSSTYIFIYIHVKTCEEVYRRVFQIQKCVYIWTFVMDGKISK